MIKESERRGKNDDKREKEEVKTIIKEREKRKKTVTRQSRRYAENPRDTTIFR